MTWGFAIVYISGREDSCVEVGPYGSDIPLHSPCHMPNYLLVWQG